MGRHRGSTSVDRKYLDDLYQKMEEMLKLAGRKDQEAKDASKKWFDQKACDRKFEVGDNVLILRPDRRSKLEALYAGPYTVLEKISPLTYCLDLQDKEARGELFMSIS